MRAIGRTGWSAFARGHAGRAAGLCIATLVLFGSSAGARASGDAPELGPPPTASDAAPLAHGPARSLGLPSPTAGGKLSGPTATGELGVARTIMATAFVVALAMAAAAVARHVGRNRGGGLAAAFGVGGPSPAGVLEILGRYPLTRGQTLVLLRVDRRVLLLSHATGGKLGRSLGMTTLCEIGDPDDVASILIKTRDAEGESISAKFRSLLTKFDAQTGEPLDAEDSADGRNVWTSGGGDRLELWPENGPGRAAAPPEAAANPIASLRERLRSLKPEGPRS